MWKLAEAVVGGAAVVEDGSPGVCGEGEEVVGGSGAGLETSAMLEARDGISGMGMLAVTFSSRAWWGQCGAGSHI